jgi:protein-S-isoprenylcysteine O-methyltransferase Ste14
MLAKLIQTALQPQITMMVAKVYLPILFPITFFICLLAHQIDIYLGFTHGYLPTPHNYGFAILLFVVGAVLWIWTYEQLVRLGEGSPSPVAGRTLKLARTGIYAYSRNPSLFGKLTGFFAVGVALNSVSFCFLLTPLILCGSLFEKVIRQEPQLIEIFGDEYELYRKEVPLFLPWKFFLRR